MYSPGSPPPPTTGPPPPPPTHPDAKDSSFSRSRSSSVTSIERESREVISSFHFCETFPRKVTEGGPGPCLMVGTSQGAVLLLDLSLPPAADQRLSQPVGVSSCGELHRFRANKTRMRQRNADIENGSF